MSRGYQRFFAVDDRIAYRARSGGPPRLVGTKDAFARNDFNAYRIDEARDDSLEDEWTRVESIALPLVRQLIAGDDSPELRDAVKVIAALHWSRSYSLDRALASIAREAQEVAPAELAADPKFEAAFRDEFGRSPELGEIKIAIDERFDDVFGSSGSFRIERMVHGHNTVLEKLEPLHVQLIRPATSRMPFIFGDTPVVHFSKMRVGWRDKLALGDADHIYMPVAPRLAVMFTHKDEGDQAAAPWIVQKMNHLVRKAAWDFIAGHPSTDFDRAIP